MLKRFFKEEDGAVTVDYVVLTAGVVALALAVGGTLYSNLSSSTETLGTTGQDLSSQGFSSGTSGDTTTPDGGG